MAAKIDKIKKKEADLKALREKEEIEETLSLLVGRDCGCSEG